MVVPLITFDIDWAPDFILEKVSQLLDKEKIKSTWFVTHDSNFIQKLKNKKNYELGIHPNFFDNSSQGKDPKSILKNLKEIIPEAVSIRTHSLYQSSPILNLFQDFGIKYDSSILLYKTKNIIPHYNPASKIFRIPYFWEDDLEMYNPSPNWSFNQTNKISGLKIYNFHPFHVVLNSENLSNYNEIKSRKNLKDITEDDFKNILNYGQGTLTFLEEMISYLKNKKTITMKNIHSIFY